MDESSRVSSPRLGLGKNAIAKEIVEWPDIAKKGVDLSPYFLVSHKRREEEEKKERRKNKGMRRNRAKIASFAGARGRRDQVEGTSREKKRLFWGKGIVPSYIDLCGLLSGRTQKKGDCKSGPDSFKGKKGGDKRGGKGSAVMRAARARKIRTRGCYFHLNFIQTLV